MKYGNINLFLKRNTNEMSKLLLNLEMQKHKLQKLCKILKME